MWKSALTLKLRQFLSLPIIHGLPCRVIAEAEMTWAMYATQMAKKILQSTESDTNLLQY